jgi:hypothetical protein
LNKKREALRHGLRSFIEDTSRELADLEGRDLQPIPASPAPQDGHPPVIPPSDAVPGPAPAVPAPSPAVGPVAIDPQVAPPAVPPPPAAPPVPEKRASGAPPAPSMPAAPPVSEKRVSGVPPAPSLPAVPPVPEKRVSAAPPASPPRAMAPATSSGRVGATKRLRRRPAPPIIVDGVNPDQVHARKGVCFAYFLNQECWRIPEAYCNSALQICITRECPVYRLHKDSLEARFAKKFRHFW